MHHASFKTLIDRQKLFDTLGQLSATQNVERAILDQTNKN